MICKKYLFGYEGGVLGKCFYFCFVKVILLVVSRIVEEGKVEE